MVSEAATTNLAPIFHLSLHVRALKAVRGGRPLFEGLDLELSPGDALVVRGPNAAGKSSLLRILAGLTPAARGRILWREGGPKWRPATRGRGFHNRIAFLGHTNAVKPALTVLDHARFWMRLAGRDGDPMAALTFAGLQDLADFPAGTLSAGQQRRLALARLACSARPLWILDEPLTSLDSDARAVLERRMSSHRRHGGIVIVASHDALALDGAIMLDLGGSQAAGRPGSALSDAMARGAAAANDTVPVVPLRGALQPLEAGE